MGKLQASRIAEIATPLGEDVLLFYRMSATEELGRLFRFEIDMLSRDNSIRFEDLLGEKITIRTDLGGGKNRYFNGHVGRFAQTGTVGDFCGYHATVYPWLWFLTRTANCRIFQEKTVPEIVKEVFRWHGFNDFEESLTGRYRTWKYRVQYRETDFNFVSRLMEQEGIYYFFRHENGKHTMVLCDAPSAHRPFPGFEDIPYFPADESLRRELDHVYIWTASNEVKSGSFALNDFDFKRPRANLNVKSTIRGNYAASDMEYYDYPGEYYQADDGEHYARMRIEEFHADYELGDGESVVRGLAAGSLFKLTGHYRSDQNREYLIVSANHEVVSDLYNADLEAKAERPFSNRFTAIPSNQPFRAACTTPKPVVHGPQSAVVVGPAGEEIYTDEYGRVKVLFHWDREGKADEKSSCWIRTSQAWAGAKWGAIHLPRIGQEVIVDFFEGDPDRPIITGRVYNGYNMPPYDLPGNKTQSGIKSKSSKGGGPNNVNELRFEDKKGQELIFLQAEKDRQTRVKHDDVSLVENEKHVTVKKDMFEMVEGDKHLTIKGDYNRAVHGTICLQTGMDMQGKAKGRYALDAGQEVHIKGNMNVVIDAGMSITLKAGGGFIVVGPAGVTISGNPVLINSGGSAGQGAGSSTQVPKDPIKPGESSAVKTEKAPPPPTASSPQSEAFKSAAVTGTPFCEMFDELNQTQQETDKELLRDIRS